MFPTPVSSPSRKTFANAQRGTTLLEVLVTIVILAIGLLGLAGLQTRLQVSEMEAYQRSQALILLNDMASRIASNRANAVDYAAAYDSGTPLGVGMDCSADIVGTATVDTDALEWCEALQGASETFSGGNAGAMVGGRGCIDDLGDGEYLITVAWQGLTPISAPPVAVACGQGDYDGGGNCVDDLCRRTVTTIVRIGDLS